MTFEEMKKIVVDTLNCDEVYRAVAFLTFKHGRIDWLERESGNYYLLLYLPSYY